MAIDTFLRGVGPHLTTDRPRPRSWTGNWAACGASCEAGRAVRGQHSPGELTAVTTPAWHSTLRVGAACGVSLHTAPGVPGFEKQSYRRTVAVRSRVGPPCRSTYPEPRPTLVRQLGQTGLLGYSLRSHDRPEAEALLSGTRCEAPFMWNYSHNGALTGVCRLCNFRRTLLVRTRGLQSSS